MWLPSKENEMISVAIIAKNEEDVLGRCLESVKGLDEIVVVDTGSTDRTKEIAKQYTDKVYDFVWCDDFAKARNYAIEQCTKDWILIIDADEYLPTIKGIYELCDKRFAAVTMDVLTNGKVSHNAIRMFQSYVRYNYPIHEYPNAKNALLSHFQVNHVKGKSKFNDPMRNVRILEKAVKDHPEESRYKYYLASEYFCRGRYSEAWEEFQRYVAISKYPAEKTDATLLMARALGSMGKIDEAVLHCLIAISQNPQFKEAFLLMAHLRPKDAKRWREMASTATNENVLFIREEKEVYKK